MERFYELVKPSSATNTSRRTNRGSVVSNGQASLLSRRTAIIQSMLSYLLRNKIRSGSLYDLAKAAGMSKGRLLYYFSNKETLQGELVASIIDQITHEMNTYRSASPEKRFELLAEYNFGGRSIPPAYTAMVLEQLALTTRNAKLRARSTKKVDVLQSHLRDLFEGAPMAKSMSVEEAAIIAGALWMGLSIASYFYTPLRREQKRRLFQRVLFQLAGLDGNQRS
jgi:AcrR family transcriptional regulator